jgi:hypothetical protein
MAAIIPEIMDTLTFYIPVLLKYVIVSLAVLHDYKLQASRMFQSLKIVMCCISDVLGKDFNTDKV